MAALSPLDINVEIKSKQPTVAGKTKAPPAKPSREKDHPPPPPEYVIEPPSSDRRTGCTYQTGRLLGKGGFAICHEGVLKGTRQVYALKIVKSRMPQKKMEQKFQTELQIHSKMHHPNIVEFYRAFTFEESTYIVLELCPNGSLMDMVKKRRFITEPEVRFYTIQIAGAIKYMHNKGIIHRDLKMGNIFLDKDMNVKIGDFGLAALLISGKDMATVRRTTLCGTPNYIAPEILEKGKKGHDHAVDIWSLGIIIFAMLTGRPPFQSPTQDEIYRKAREREYDWPAMDKADNYICREAKDLVSTMLQPAEERPDCDTIVQHSFFSCGWMPKSSEMSIKLRETSPDPNMFTGFRGGRPSLIRNLKELCIKSDVGPWCKEPSSQGSLYRQMAQEQKAGLTPDIPLRPDVVYRPFDEVMREHRAALRRGEDIPLNNSPQKAEQHDRSLAYRPADSRVPQSFAAQQRAQNQPATSVMAPPRRPRAQAEPEVAPRLSRSNAETGATTQRENGSRTAPEKSDAIEPRPDPLRRQRSQVDQAAASCSTKALGATISGAPRRAASRTNSEDKPESAPVTVEERLGGEMAKELAKPKEKQPPQPVMDSMFSPGEKTQKLASSRPDDVLRRLQKFQAEIQRALNSRSLGTVSKPTDEHHLVVKWVDYTNKYGLGYILNDGSVGCIFKALPTENDAKTYTPPSGIVVRNGEKHLMQRENKQYIDRDQLVPMAEGGDIEFYENRGMDGIVLGKVPAKDFTASKDPGRSMRLHRGKDEWEDRKREKLVVWKKFANYMVVFGRDEEHPRDEPVGRLNTEPHSGMVITSYQRFGDVGVWGFYDGSFQFNFPDHTKLILSADGSWCDFYHLPQEAARDLAEKGTIKASALDDRQHLSYSVQAMLNFMAKSSASARTRRAAVEVDPMIQGIPAANDFRRKIQFVNEVIKEWIENGGVGCSAMDPENRLRWTGYRECINTKVPYKHVWVTVGALKGDDRRVAWFDPREPAKIVPDIEQPAT